MGYSIIDLFCGCGGLSCGFVQEGFDILAGVDFYKPSLETFAVNFPGAMTFQEDITSLRPEALRERMALKRGELDCLIGGPPCQGFSKNVPATQRSMNDPRNILMRVFLNFVREFQPKVLLIENVSEVVNAYEQSISRYILAELCSMGYQVKLQTLNAAQYGVPQLRRRAFFLASRCNGIFFPAPTHDALIKTPQHSPICAEPMQPFVSVWNAIRDLPSMKAGEGQPFCAYTEQNTSAFLWEVRGKQNEVSDHQARSLTQIQMERIACLGEGQGLKDLPDHLRPKSGYSGAYARLFPDEPARTITRWVFHPGSGRFVHPYDNRVITIREAARLQGFPDWFFFTGSYIQKSHQVGEAVPPLLVRHLARSLASAL